MALICLASAKGAPGTTTSAMLLAALWPRESILVDADPMGGDVALRLPGDTGAPLRTDSGLLSLLQAARRGLTPNVVLSHCQKAQGGQLVIPGLEGPEQAAAVGGLWDEVGSTFAGLPDHDVIIDVGQAYPGATTLPLLRRAAAVVFVTRPTLPGIVHTRQRIAALRSELAASDGFGPRVGFVIREGHKGRQQDTDAAVAEIGQSSESLRYFGPIAHDRESARMFEGIPQRHPERSLLARSGAAVVTALTDVLPERPVARVAMDAGPVDQPAPRPATTSTTPADPPASTAPARSTNPFLQNDPEGQSPDSYTWGAPLPGPSTTASQPDNEFTPPMVDSVTGGQPENRPAATRREARISRHGVKRRKS